MLRKLLLAVVVLALAVTAIFGVVYTRDLRGQVEEARAQVPLVEADTAQAEAEARTAKKQKAAAERRADKAEAEARKAKKAQKEAEAKLLARQRAKAEAERRAAAQAEARTPDLVPCGPYGEDGCPPGGPFPNGPKHDPLDETDGYCSEYEKGSNSPDCNS
jgi:chemotaxis protein histidine kinase CheA